jgi:exoribonuclease II
MNERIKEFAIQSGLPTALDYHQKRYEKFAELIVRECMEVANIASADLIKEHFGVEDITTHEIKLTTDPERIRQANYLLNGGR